MGQQQLLLIVLGVIIVGVAIVAGIGLFNSGAEEAAKDELVSQCLAIASNAQQWYKKPVAMGGGGNSFTGYGIPVRMTATSSAGAIDASTGVPSTAGYVLTAGAQQITITATPNQSGYNWNVTCVVDPLNITTAVNDVTPGG